MGLTKSITGKNDELRTGRSHDSGVRNEFRAPIIRGRATAQLDRKRLLQQSGFIQITGTARKVVDLLQKHEVRIFRAQELGDSLKGSSDVTGSYDRIGATVMEEVVTYTRTELHIVGNDFDGLAGR